MEVSETIDPRTLVGAQIVYRLRFTQIRQSGERVASWGSEVTATVTTVHEPSPDNVQLVTERSVRLRWGVDEITVVSPGVAQEVIDHPDYRPDVTALASGDTLSLWSDYLHVSVADGVSVDYSEPVSDDAVRQAIAVLTAYLALKEGRS